jgi:DnaD/phage-associated family protein|nr:MAG TPA: Replication initiation and membrane attachment [Caudoviricetes sp.]
MNYIKQINTFYKLIQDNPLSSNAQCLYNYLLNKCSELGWKSEFSVSNLIVCGFTSLSRQALDRARNELIQKGYLKYKKGYSNQAGKYLIVCFDIQNDTQDNAQNDIQGGHKVSTLNKLKETKQKENISMQSVIDFYDQNINLITPFEFQKLQDFSNMESELIIFAMQKAVTANKRNFNYIEGILKNWKVKGISTLIQAKNEEQEFRRLKENVGQKEETDEEKNARIIREMEATVNGNSGIR